MPFIQGKHRCGCCFKEGDVIKCRVCGVEDLSLSINICDKCWTERYNPLEDCPGCGNEHRKLSMENCRLGFCYACHMRETKEESKFCKKQKWKV